MQQDDRITCRTKVGLLSGCRASDRAAPLAPGNDDTGSPVSTLLLYLIGAGGPRQWLAAVPWQLHRALTELQGSSLVIGSLACGPHPDLGTEVAGVAEALNEFSRLGWLALSGDGLLRTWVVKNEGLAVARRSLLRIAPSQVRIVQVVGRRWAALASTSLNSWRTVVESSRSHVTSSSPMRRQPREPALR